MDYNVALDALQAQATVDGAATEKKLAFVFRSINTTLDAQTTVWAAAASGTRLMGIGIFDDRDTIVAEATKWAPRWDNYEVIVLE
ncbi:hypothetical protein E3T46_05785 [Cryobacterium sp. Hh11]|uniref:hypothetical protein n=1 Tax=Cryobacterium sp. Hh11 TaxID=2555868 RepID=UPI0011014393|nr:hypothetical protein [Cryobacterium sp. Hh11]TFD52376.1 hypothetical protein E3T46_05785 [Cryobacterium sp. Hh11]